MSSVMVFALRAPVGGEVGGVLAPLLATQGLIADGRAGESTPALTRAPRKPHDGARAALVSRAGDGALNVPRHGLGTGHVDTVRVLTDRVLLTPIKADSWANAS